MRQSGLPVDALHRKARRPGRQSDFFKALRSGRPGAIRITTGCDESRRSQTTRLVPSSVELGIVPRPHDGKRLEPASGVDEVDACVRRLAGVPGWCLGDHREGGPPCRDLSSSMLAISDEEVVSALRFIRENASRPIQVRDVVSRGSLSHHTLNARFHRALGHSILKELTRSRTDQIARLLRETSDPISRIAQVLGFSTHHHVARYFRKATGMTPGEYRRRLGSRNTTGAR